MNKKKRKPDYITLRKILEKDLSRKVTEDEARLIGKWILRFYAHLHNKK